MNMLQALHRSRQSVWLDDFERSLIVNDRLEAYIAQDRLQGILSNFDSLERSLCQGTDYDHDFQAIQRQPNTDTLRDRLDVNIRHLQKLSKPFPERDLELFKRL